MHSEYIVRSKYSVQAIGPFIKLDLASEADI